MKSLQPKQIDIVVLTLSWLLTSILVGLFGALDELEGSATLSASTALRQAFKTGTLIFIAGAPVCWFLYSKVRQQNPNTKIQ